MQQINSINSAASQRHVTLSADEHEHDVTNVGLFTPFETGKIVWWIIIFRLMFPLFKVKLVRKKAIHLYGVSW